MGGVEFPTNFGLADAELRDQINHIYHLFKELVQWATTVWFKAKVEN